MGKQKKNFVKLKQKTTKVKVPKNTYNRINKTAIIPICENRYAANENSSALVPYTNAIFYNKRAFHDARKFSNFYVNEKNNKNQNNENRNDLIAKTIKIFLGLLFQKKNKNENSSYLDSISYFLEVFFWSKMRTLYYTCNWIYTTNHKRIAVNYFWFVILSGIVGMVLATVIRLEFAYPGVGIFAGDSLQYLSLVTAHGVVMVFFMIMPLLFGAFANFLLPTQLGVHDVAFPRLNSAAFWFLPGGLLMLAQLVCVDRRYQRMNCFNIREIQSILKRRFFTDLLNDHEINENLHKSMVNLKYKTNALSSQEPNLNLFYNTGITYSGKVRNFMFGDANNEYGFLKFNNSFFSFINRFLPYYTFYFINYIIVFLTKNVVEAGFKNLLDMFSNILLYTTNSTSNLFTKLWDFSLSFLNTLTDYKIFRIFFKKVILSLNDFFLNQFNLFFKTKNLVIGLKETNSFGYLATENNKNLPNIDELSSGTPFNVKAFLKDFIFLFNDVETFFLANLLGYVVKYPITDFKKSIFFANEARLFDRPFSRISFENLSYFKTSPNNVLSNNQNKSDIHLFQKNEEAMKNLKNYFSYSNFNSYYVYVYLAIYIFFDLIRLLFSLVLNLFNFRNASILINDFNDLITSWYIPMIISDNIFYVFWQKVHKVWSIIKNLVLFDFTNNYTQFDALLSFKKSYNNVWFSSTENTNSTTSYTYLTLNNLNIWVSNFFKNFIKVFFGESSFIYNINSHSFNQTLFYATDTLFANLKNNNNSAFFSNFFFNKFVTESFGSNEETFSNYRYQKFDNPIFKYDYKSGDYYPKLYKEAYSYLFSSSNDLTGGLRQAPWFLSNNYSETFSLNFLNYTNNLNSKEVTHSWNESKFMHSSSFYNFFFILSKENLYFSKRWVSLNSMDQKFYKFFHTSSMQQRIYNNWRHLKFTREAWRCKLLMARHQKTLYKRYVNEDGVFWSIERNAKDLLPGWAMITPFSSRTRFTAVGKVDIGLMGVLLVLNSSIISGANFLVTYRYLSTLNNRKMRDARAFFTEAVMVSSWMMIAANPMLVIGIIMLLSDRHWQTSFFDYSGGGDTVLFQHMFWFFGHPEVYVIIIPTFGFTNTMLSYYLKKRISARASLIYSMYTIAFLGFFVWGHHMYMVGLAHTTRMLFSTLTVMISVPAATKLMHWCVTTANSSFAMELPLVCTFTFVFLFTSGGISGMCVAHTGMDVLFHDTFYVIGHFHVMLAGGAMIACFGAFYFYFVAIFGVKYSRIYAYLHFVYYLLGQLFTVIPMFWLGYAGMPRRVLDYPSSFGGWHSVISGGHMLSVAGLIAFFIMIFDSLRQAKAATRNTFGIGRYNTRLNFYLFELSKLNNVQQKAWALFRFIHIKSLKLNNLNFYNLETQELTLFSYVFLQKSKQ